MKSEDPIISIRGLCKGFDGKEVLQGVDLDIPRGGTTAIIGKSGEGKSVLLKCIVGLLKPDSGSIQIHCDEGREDCFDRVGFMFQHNALFESMTALENVALPLLERSSMKRLKVKARVKNLFRQLDLQEIEEKYPAQLSGGMQKRVALARALILNPEIVLFDEPTTGLDPLRKNTVFMMIRRYQQKFGYTALMVSHDLPDVLYFTDWVAALNQGRIGFMGTPIELEQESSQLADEFLHSSKYLRGELIGLEPLYELRKNFDEYRTKVRSIVELRLDPMAEIEEEGGEVAAHLLESAVVHQFGYAVSQDQQAYSINGSGVLIGCDHTEDPEAVKKLLEGGKEAFRKQIEGLKMRHCTEFKVTWALVPIREDQSLDEALEELKHKRSELFFHQCK